MNAMLPVKILPPTPGESPPSSEARNPSLAPWTAGVSREQELHSLVVGVQSFGAGLESLPGAPRDAYRLYLELSNTHRFPLGKATPLTNPTRLDFSEAVQQWCATLPSSPHRVALLYLSTHGCYIDGVYHLCMADASFAEGAYHNTVSWPELRTWLTPLQNHPVLVIVDGCRQVKRRSSPLPSPLTSTLPLQREDIVLRGEQWAVMTAATYGHLAQEGDTADDGPHGLFSHALVQALQSWPVSQPLRLGSLYRAVQERLRTEARHKSWPLQQEPRLYVGHLDLGEMVLAAPPAQTPGSPQVTRRRIPWWGGALLLVLLATVGVGAMSWSPAVSSETCQRCVRRQWSRLRRRDCTAHQSIPGAPLSSSPAFCALPCNRYNLRTVARRCRRVCTREGVRLRQPFRRMLQTTAMGEAFRTHCQTTLQTVTAP